MTGLSVQGCTNYNIAWGRGGKGEIKAGRVNCPKNFVLHCSLCDIGVRRAGALCALNLNCEAEYVCVYFIELNF